MSEPGSTDSLDAVAALLDHDFDNRAILTQALTHTSALKKGRRAKESYERLEFYGDRVLGQVIAAELLIRFPNADAGELAVRFNGLVQRETLALVAENLGLGLHIIMSGGEAGQGGAQKPAILSDVCEALIAALAIDGGIVPAQTFILRHWDSLFVNVDGPVRDPKSRLQEYSQARSMPTPEYVVIDRTGPDHDPVFTVEVTLEDGKTARGQGASKKTGERRAAEILLSLLEEKGKI